MLGTRKKIRDRASVLCDRNLLWRSFIEKTSSSAFTPRKIASGSFAHLLACGFNPQFQFLAAELPYPPSSCPCPSHTFQSCEESVNWQPLWSLPLRVADELDDLSSTKTTALTFCFVFRGFALRRWKVRHCPLLEFR